MYIYIILHLVLKHCRFFKHLKAHHQTLLHCQGTHQEGSCPKPLWILWQPGIRELLGFAPHDTYWYLVIPHGNAKPVNPLNLTQPGPLPCKWSAICKVSERYTYMAKFYFSLDPRPWRNTTICNGWGARLEDLGSHTATLPICIRQKGHNMPTRSPGPRCNLNSKITSWFIDRTLTGGARKKVIMTYHDNHNMPKATELVGNLHIWLENHDFL